METVKACGAGHYGARRGTAHTLAHTARQRQAGQGLQLGPGWRTGCGTPPGHHHLKYRKPLNESSVTTENHFTESQKAVSRFALTGWPSSLR